MLNRSKFLAVLLFTTAGFSGYQPVRAASDTQYAQVLACVSQIVSDADWEECSRLIEADCSKSDYGSTAHLTCLERLRDDWKGYFEASREETLKILNAGGQRALNRFAAGWVGMVHNRCSANAQFQQKVSPGIAHIQCQLAETVGFSAELAACREGKSDAPFCLLKERD